MAEAGQEGALDAGVDGDLTDVDGCIRVLADYGESLVIIWLPGTEVLREGDETVEVRYGDETLSIGDSVSVSGGFSTPKNGLSSSADVSSCETAKFFAAN